MTIPHIVQAPLSALPAAATRQNAQQAGGGSDPTRYGMTMWFQIIVTDPTGTKQDLGLWSGCSGLGVRLETRALRSGGEYQAPYLYPEEITYPEVTLERAMESATSGQVRTWLEDVAGKWIGSEDGGATMVTSRSGGSQQGQSGFRGTTVTIRLYTSLAPTPVIGPLTKSQATREVAMWELADAIPTAWQAPTLSSRNGDVAIERLTLVHRGFLKPDLGTPAGAGGLNSQGQGRLKLSKVDAKSPADTLEFQYNPTSLTEEMTLRGSEDDHRMTLQSATGVSLVYNRKNITLSDLHIEGVEAVKDSYDKLWKWTEPLIGSNQDSGQASGGSKPTHRVEVLILQMGSGTKGVVVNEHVSIKRVAFQYLRFTSAGVPCRAKLTLGVTVLAKGDQGAPGAQGNGTTGV